MRRGRRDMRGSSRIAAHARAEPRRAPARGARTWLAPTVIACVSAVLLFWNLTDTHLWQDEANTAVLGVRLMQHGKPLAWDGRNLLSDDNFVAQDRKSIDERTRSAAPAVQDCIRRGVMTADGMWTYHPWGQFLLAGASIQLLGSTTLAARLPFALAGLATVLALYWLARRFLRSELIAALACTLLLFNVYWLLHSRQARYYPLSSLFLVLTVIAYGRWQQGGRWGAAIFVAVAWFWFQIDYGTIWPIVGVLLLDALVAALRSHWKEAWKPIAAGAALALALVPFVFFYRLTTRQSVQLGTWLHRFQGAVFNINEYVVPVLVVLAALVLVVIRRRQLSPFEARLIVLACASLVALAFWVPTVAPMRFVRYVIMAAPLGAMLAAWLCVRGLGSHARWAAWSAVAILALTPWLCMPINALLRFQSRVTGTILRSELPLLGTDIFGHRLDPNRTVIEWLQRNARPTDEILINYEDLPLMYYLPNPIRGGIAAFRAEDPTSPPRFAIMRRTVPFVHWPVFTREIARHYWSPVPVNAPDIRWGNNPDPEGHRQDRMRAENLLFYERVDSTAAIP